MSQLPWQPACVSFLAIWRSMRSIAGASTPLDGRRSSVNAGISPSIQAKCASCASTSATLSAPIAAIDIDIAVRQITSPDARLAVAEANIDCNFHLAAFDGPGRRSFVVLDRAFATFGDNLIAKGDLELVAIRCLASLTDRHDDAPPVGVFAGDRGFYKRRIRDRHRDTLGGVIRLGASNIDTDQFLRAL